MQMNQQRGINSFKTNGTFVNGFLLSFNKLSDIHSKKNDLNELEAFLAAKVEGVEHLKLALALLFQNANHPKPRVQRVSIIVIGLIAEVFKDQILTFLPNIFHILTQKLKTEDIELQSVIGDTVEKLTQFSIRNLTTYMQCSNLETMLNELFELCYNENSYTQIGAGLCISRIIHFSPPECLNVIMDDLIQKIAILLGLSNFKAHLQLYECVLSFLVISKAEKEQVGEILKGLIPNIIGDLTHKDSHVRKIALDLVSMIYSLVPEVLIPRKEELLKRLNFCRFDEVKSVRDTSFITIANIQKLKDITNETENTKKPIRSSSTNTNQLKTKPHQTNPKPSQTRVASTKRTNSPAPAASKSSTRSWDSNKLLFSNVSKNRITQTSKAKPRPVITTLKSIPPFFNSNAHKKSQQSSASSVKRTQSPQTKHEKRTVTPSKFRGRDPEYYVQLFGSADKTYKYVVSQQKAKVFDEEYDTALKANEFRDDDDVSTQMELSPNPFKERSLIYHQKQQRTVSAQRIFSSPTSAGLMNSSCPENNHKVSSYQNDESIRKDIGSMLEKLEVMNQQQSEILKSLSTFRSGTYDEVSSLKRRINSLEDVIQEVRHTKQALSPYLLPAAPQTYMTNPVIYSSQVDFNSVNSHQAETYMTANPSAYSSDTQVNYGAKYESAQDSKIPAFFNEYQSIYMNPAASKNTRSLISKGSAVKAMDLRLTETQQKIGRKSDETVDDSKKTVQERIQELFKNGSIKDAYRVCTEEGSQEDLLHLMKKTGQVIDQIEGSVLNKVLARLKLRVSNQENCILAIDWIEEAVHNSQEVSRDTLMILHDKMTWGFQNKKELPETEVKRVQSIVATIEQRIDKTIKRKASEVI